MHVVIQLRKRFKMSPFREPGEFLSGRGLLERWKERVHRGNESWICIVRYTSAPLFLVEALGILKHGSTSSIVHFRSAVPSPEGGRRRRTPR